MIVQQAGYVTPRSTVQRTRARRVLDDLRRQGLTVTPGRLELYAMARYAGEVPHSLIREVVEIALVLEGGATPLPPSQPTAAGLTGNDVREILRRELRANPDALSTELIETVLAEGPLAIQPTYIPQMVSAVRRELGIRRPVMGRPRRIA